MKKTTETYRNPLTLATNSVRYFEKSGKHVIAHDMNCGEDICLDVFRFENIEEARGMWRIIRKLIINRGYTEKIEGACLHKIDTPRPILERIPPTLP